MVAFLIEIILLFFVFCGTILLVQGTRKVPVQYAKRIVGNKQYGGVRQYIPLKINAAGVMPIIFAQAIMLLPISFVIMQLLNRYPVLQLLFLISPVFGITSLSLS